MLAPAEAVVDLIHEFEWERAMASVQEEIKQTLYELEDAELTAERRQEVALLRLKFRRDARLNVEDLGKLRRLALVSL